MPHIPWEEIDWFQALLTLALLGVIIIAIVKGWGIPAKITRVLDLILGRPEQQGIPAIPSMDKRIEDLRTDLISATEAQNREIAEIKAQVVPNHGSTNKLSEEVQQVQGAIVDLRQALQALADRFEQHLKK